MGIIETTINNMTLVDLKKARVSSISEDPKLTKKLIELVIENLKDVEANNGYSGIANKLGLTKQQVVEIHNAMNKRINELTITKEVI